MPKYVFINDEQKTNERIKKNPKTETWNNDEEQSRGGDVHSEGKPKKRKMKNKK